MIIAVINTAFTGDFFPAAGFVVPFFAMLLLTGCAGGRFGVTLPFETGGLFGAALPFGTGGLFGIVLSTAAGRAPDTVLASCVVPLGGGVFDLLFVLLLLTSFTLVSPIHRDVP